VSVYSGFDGDRDSLNLCQISPTPMDRARTGDVQPGSPLAPTASPTSGNLPSEEASVGGKKLDLSTSSAVIQDAPIDVVAEVLSNRAYLSNKSNVVVPDLTIVPSTKPEIPPITANHGDFDQSIRNEQDASMGVVGPPTAFAPAASISDSTTVRPKPLKSTALPQQDNGKNIQ